MNKPIEIEEDNEKSPAKITLESKFFVFFINDIEKPLTQQKPEMKMPHKMYENSIESSIISSKSMLTASKIRVNTDNEQGNLNFRARIIVYFSKRTI